MTRIVVGVVGLAGIIAGVAQSPVLREDPLRTAALQRPSASDAVSRSTIVSGQPFSRGIAIETRRQVENPWNIQLNFRTAVSVGRGDVLLATFYHRILQPAGIGGFTAFIFEQASPPWTKSANQTISVGSSEWQRTQIAFEAADGYAAGAAQVNFQLGFAPQTVELGGIEIVNFGKGRTLDDVRAEIDSSVSYAGREPDAPWRLEAERRIDRHRKATLRIRVIDAEGRPVAGAPVRVRQSEHAFAFGSAVGAANLLERGRDGDRYREVVSQSFNRVTIENNLKWPMWERERERGIRAVDWLVRHGIEVRGHTILWPSWDRMPDDVRGLAGDPSVLRVRVNNRIRDVTTALAGKLVDWDVVNEPFTEHDLMDVLGWDELVHWYRLARQGDPDATLYLNDFAILAATGTTSAHQNHLFETLQFLIDRGAPLGGIGMQGHFQGFLTPPTTLYAILERFDVFGLPIQITEFDVDASDSQLQADYLRDFFTVVFSHPRVEGIIMWGFWEGRHWRPRAALYDQDWTLRPHGQQWRDLVFDRWWTDVDGVSGADGVFEARGFKGDYDVEVEHQGASVREPVELREDASVDVRLSGGDGAGDGDGAVAPRFLVDGFRVELNGVRLLLRKEPQQAVALWVSEDLESWERFVTAAAETTEIEIRHGVTSKEGARFYRASVDR